MEKNIEPNGIEIYESKDGAARFYIAYVSKDCSTGIMILKPKAALPKHNRPNAIENLTQISGKCLMKLFDKNDNQTDIELTVGEGVRMPRKYIKMQKRKNTTFQAFLKYHRRIFRISVHPNSLCSKTNIPFRIFKLLPTTVRLSP